MSLVTRRLKAKASFQFLIGTVKIADHGGELLKDIEFQFLIGTVKITSIEINCLPGQGFQFLIGTVKIEG